MTSPDTTSNRFDEAAKTWDSPDKIAMSARIAQAMQQCVPFAPDMSILDYGCGTGLIALALRPGVAAVDCMDTSTGMLEALRAKIRAQDMHTVRAIHKDLEREDLVEGPYDAIVTAMTFHHLHDPAAMVQTFANGLKPRGYLAIADLVQEDGSFHGMEHEHELGVKHRGFDPDQVVRWLEQAGFQDIHTTIAYSMEKNGRLYPIFLVSGRRVDESDG